MSILPISSHQLQHKVWDERVPTGIPDLDAMLEGKGYYRGTSILVTGTAGSGKTTVAASYIDAACKRGERCLYIDFEESSFQVRATCSPLASIWATGPGKGCWCTRLGARRSSASRCTFSAFTN